VEKNGSTVTSTKQCVWNGSSIAEERDASNVVTRRFYSQGEQIGAASYFYTRDHLGSIRELTDGSGVVQARYDYDPYGRRPKITGTLDASFGFTGHYYHAPSNLNLALYRGYDSDLGRWLSRDPYRSPALEMTRAPWRDFKRGKFRCRPEGAEISSEARNLYAYVGNSPAVHFDPLGLQTAAPQAAGCDGIPDCLETPAIRTCCDEHDRCYQRYGCNEGSWALLGTVRDACNECNTRVTACFLRAIGNTIFGGGPIGKR
jgi:RHS repeat-associated protein